MKRAAFVLFCVCAAGSMTSYGVVVHYDDYESRAIGSGFPAWNWADGACTHAAIFADDSGSIVVKHTGTIDNTAGTEPVNTRYGSKWDIALSGNTSSNPADYTIELDLRSLSGSWDPLGLEVWVLTYNPAVGTGTYGHGFPTVELSQSAGWVHVKFNLAEYTKDWWEGTEWDLTNPAWSIEIGMPWPGLPVAVGESWTQVWEMDNLKITMIPEPMSLVLTGLGSLIIVRKRS